MNGKARQQRQKDQLSGGTACREYAHHQAAMTDKPAIGDGGTKDRGHHTAAGADDDAPEGHQLPSRLHENGKKDADSKETEGDGYRSPQTKTIHDRDGEGTHQAEQHDVDPNRGTDLRPRPGEFALQRDDQHAGC